MRKFTFLIILIVSLFSIQSYAQRKMENLNHGTMAVKTSDGVYVSWRILGNEWKDVSYNLYRDGTKINTEPIDGASNYKDASGTTSSIYFVRAVVDGVEQMQMDTASVWTGGSYDIPVVTKDGDYTINDAAVGDLDGDGEYEIIIKWKSGEISDFSSDKYHLLEAYHLDPEDNLDEFGNVVPMWTINMGPNLFQCTEVNFLVWDIDEDGKAEVITRTSDGTVDGLGNDFGDVDLDIAGSYAGDGIIDYRFSVMSTTEDIAAGYRTQGPDFISVFNGETGGEIAREQYIERDPMEQYGNTGGGAAHRSTKCMFTVAYLDGKKPSVVMGRGIYERIKMEAWDFDGTDLTKRWHFDTQDAPDGYHGSGNHNLSQADVDYDGKDEIIYGAMVIDDDGTGLNTTGFGHGDALHASDFNPDRFGLEIWDAGETTFGASYRTGETGEILFRYIANRDCGRACAGDINPDYRGAEVWAATECPIYSSTGKIIDTDNSIPMNFMIWWDGDLLREFLDHSFDLNTGIGIGYIKKGKSSSTLTTLLTATGTLSNNWSKGTPCISADLFGDWREEVIWRRDDNAAIRVYYTTKSTDNRLYTLMHDAQYRAAIGWQMNSYNQPPHPSFFLGYGMDSVPPPSIVTNELVWKSGSTWDNSSSNFTRDDGAIAFTDGDDVLFDLSGDNASNIAVTGSLSPRSVRVQTATDYTFEGSGTLTGSMDLVKAGTGKTIFNNENTYTGLTRVFLGKFEINAPLPSSTVIVKRFAEFYGGASVGKDILLQAGSHLYCGAEDAAATSFEIGGNLHMLGGGNVHLDLSDNADGTTKTNDIIEIAGDLVLEGTNNIYINMLDGDLEAGTYDLIKYTGSFDGDIATINVKGIPTKSVELILGDGVIQMDVKAIRSAGVVSWEGSVNSDWDLATTSNWNNNGVSDIFVSDDAVTFDDNGSANTTINVAQDVQVSSVDVNASIDYTFTGSGSILGEGGLTKDGTGTLKISNNHDYTGVTTILGGEIQVSDLTNGGYAGAIGAASSDASNIVINGGTLNVTGTSTVITDRGLTIGENDGTLKVPYDVVIEGNVQGSGSLVKTGSGTLTLSATNTQSGGTILEDGTITLGTDEANIGGLGGKITFNGGTLQMKSSNSYTNGCSWGIEVPDGKTGTLNADMRCQLTGKLTGGGRLNFYTPFVRTDLMGNWSEFTGTINVSTDGDGGDFRHYNRYGYTNATLIIGNNVNMYVENHGYTTSQSIGTLMLFTNATLMGYTGYFTWKIGSNNGNSLIYGTITENGNGKTTIDKVGTGNMTLKNANSYKNGTNVREGSLICQNTTGSATGTGPVNIYSSGTLLGFGTCSGAVNVYDGGTLAGTLTLESNVSVAGGGIVSPNGNNIGELSVGGTLTMNENSVYAITIDSDGKTSDKTTVTGAVTLNGALEVTITGDAGLAAGDKFQVLSGSAISGTFASISPAVPGTGLAWDLSDIQNGYLGVTISNGLAEVLAGQTGITPNPSNGMFAVQLPTFTGGVKYVISDLNGRSLQSGYFTSQKEQLDLRNEASGVYMMKLELDDVIITKRIVIRK